VPEEEEGLAMPTLCLYLGFRLRWDSSEGFDGIQLGWLMSKERTYLAQINYSDRKHDRFDPQMVVKIET